MIGRAVSEKSGLPSRNALDDWDHVASDLRAEGADMTPPVATIAIPTFNRPELLVDAVRSALAQDFAHPFEIAIFDNQPNSGGWETLLEKVPELRGCSFRYWNHAENMGIFGNFNRAIRLSRGEWITLLMDDDLLDPGYLSTMFAEIARRPGVDGIVCHKRSLDERPEGEAPRTMLHRAAVRAFFHLRFRGRRSRRVTASKLFWWPGGVVGTPAGFLFRRPAAMKVGGFNPEKGMAADYWFYATFAAAFELRQHKASAAVVRIGVNESANPSTLRESLVSTHALQRAMAAELVPRWWARFAPLIIARVRAYQHDLWKVDTPPAEVEALLGVRLPKDRPLLYKAARLLFGGY